MRAYVAFKFSMKKEGGTVRFAVPPCANAPGILPGPMAQTIASEQGTFGSSRTYQGAVKLAAERQFQFSGLQNMISVDMMLLNITLQQQWTRARHT